MKWLLLFCVALSSAASYAPAAYYVQQPARQESLEAPKAVQALLDIGDKYSSTTTRELRLIRQGEDVSADYTYGDFGDSFSLAGDGTGAVKLTVGPVSTPVIRPTETVNTLVIRVFASTPQTSTTLRNLVVNGQALPDISASGPAGVSTMEVYGVTSAATVNFTGTLQFANAGPIFRPIAGDSGVEFYFTTTSVPVPEPTGAAAGAVAIASILLRRKRRA